MTQIIQGLDTIHIDPAILALLPEQGCVELQQDAPGKVHDFHAHAVDETIVLVQGSLNFWWEGSECVCRAGDTILLPAGTRHKSEALAKGAIYIIATHPAEAVHGEI